MTKAESIDSKHTESLNIKASVSTAEKRKRTDTNGKWHRGDATWIFSTKLTSGKVFQI